MNLFCYLTCSGLQCKGQKKEVALILSQCRFFLVGALDAGVGGAAFSTRAKHTAALLADFVTFCFFGGVV